MLAEVDIQFIFSIEMLKLPISVRIKSEPKLEWFMYYVSIIDAKAKMDGSTNRCNLNKDF